MVKRKHPTKYYRVSEVASMFGYSPQWVKEKEMASSFRYEDEKIIFPKRAVPNMEKKEYGHRRYTIRQISDMLESLRRRNQISPERYEIVRRIVDDFIEIEAFREKMWRSK